MVDTNTSVNTLSALSGPPTTNLDKIKLDKSPAKSEGAAKRLSDDFDQFLLLLTTQLKNQDPTNPLDTNEFTQQLVSFSGVEQAVQTNKNLEQLIGLSSGTQVNNAVGYIGKVVDAEGNQSSLKASRAEFAYDLPAGTTGAQLSIINSLGQVVFTGNGSIKPGKNVAIWDGSNNFTGGQEPDGIYTLVVKAKDATDKLFDATTYTTGTVTSVDLKDGAMTLSLDGIPITLDKVKSVRAPALAI